MTETRSDHLTVFCENHTAIVYGSGSDWMAQLASVTNHISPWRKWFGRRELAENYAKGLASHGMHEPIADVVRYG